MKEDLVVVLGIMLPWIGTILGAAMALFLKRSLNPRVNKTLSGFAAGVMIAASVWSLLLPALEMAEEAGVVPSIPAVTGFLVGALFLLLLDILIRWITRHSSNPDGTTSQSKRNMVMLAVTLHNLPEGMAVGVTLAGLIRGDAVTTAAAMSLVIGISVQNFPEGAIISMPLAAAGKGKGRAFMMGVLSGIVEPIGALVTLVLTWLIAPALPYILAFAAGAMIYVVAEELIPQAQAGPHSYMGTIGVTLGFAAMMLLDTLLG